MGQVVPSSQIGREKNPAGNGSKAINQKATL